MNELRALCRVAALFALAACSTEEGATPQCNDLASCNPVAVCAKAPDDPIQCCVSPDGGPFVGTDLTNCLYGFGVVPDAGPTGGAGGTGGGGGAGGGASGGTGGGTGGAGGGG